jgi:hypothetical protein
MERQIQLFNPRRYPEVHVVAFGNRRVAKAARGVPKNPLTCVDQQPCVRTIAGPCVLHCHQRQALWAGVDIRHAVNVRLRRENFVAASSTGCQSERGRKNKSATFHHDLTVDNREKDERDDDCDRCLRDHAHEAIKCLFLNVGVHFAMLVISHCVFPLVQFVLALADS